MTITATHPLAHRGRRVTFAYRRDPTTFHPGIITGPGDVPSVVTIRLDGTRNLLHIPVDSPNLIYLDAVQPVPVLPMGRFTPTLADLDGFEWEGVPVCEIGEEVVIALTSERRVAVSAMTAYFVMVLGIHDTPITRSTPGLRYGVGLFEWEPEDAGTPWTVRFGRQGDDHAVPIHYLNP